MYCHSKTGELESVYTKIIKEQMEALMSLTQLMSDSGVYVVHFDMTSFTKSLTSLRTESVMSHLSAVLGLDLLDLHTRVVSFFTKWR